MFPPFQMDGMGEIVRYAVIGAAGQLGRDLCPRLTGEVLAWGRDRADLTQPDRLRAALAEARPDVVVNCAAYNFVDRAESEPAAAFAVNSLGVRNLALACRDLDLALVHFSTDYVFGQDNSRSLPYQETDAPYSWQLIAVTWAAMPASSKIARANSYQLHTPAFVR